MVINMILINAFQAGWNLLVPGYYTSLTTRNQFSTPSPLKVSWETCHLSLLVTPEPFSTACTIFFQSARRQPGGFQGRMQDVVCQFVGFGLVLRYCHASLLNSPIKQVTCVGGRAELNPRSPSHTTGNRFSLAN